MASLRDGIYYTRMRVPPRFRHVDGRAEVWISLGTGDKRDAELEEIKARAALVAEWEARAGVGGTPEEQFRRAATIAASRGFTYRTAPELAADQLDEILTRVEAVPAGANSQEIAAILGGVEEPRIMLSGLVEYIEGLDTAEKANRGKNPDQLRKWRNPRKRAVANLRRALAAAKRPDDIPVEDVRHEIATLHWNWWERRLAGKIDVAAGKLEPSTANKDYDYLGGMLKLFWLSISGQNPKPYSGLTHTDRFTEPKRKHEFTPEWIGERIIAPGAMAGLNDEAQDITTIAAETGCRQSEIYNTPECDWHLDAPVPHFLIQPILEGPDRREIKNIHSKRAVPLVGAALEAARRRQGQFPRYRGNSTYSDTVNKFFRENKLFPDDGKTYTLGGLRHSWESRMKAIGLESDDRGMIMGHSVKKIRGREVYGDLTDLEMRQCVALLVAIHPSGSGFLTEDEERQALSGRLVKLLAEAKKKMEQE